MDAPLLAAVLIVKDEEQDLPGCLDSLAALRPVLGEICVYDTGSTDATVAIAESRGARVERGFWDSDFARARNAATAMTRAKWVLSIDADERVVAEAGALAAALRRGLTEGLTGWDTFDIVIVDVDERARPIAQHPFGKLFRPGRARWAAPIHENLVSVRDRQTLTVVDMPPTTLRLVHHGYAMQVTRQTKATRNAEVAGSGLALDRDATPDATAKLHADRARALAVHKEHAAAASAAFDDALRVDGVDPETRVVILLDAARFHLGTDERSRVPALLLEAESLGAPADTIRWYRASLLLEDGRPAEALPLLRGLRSVRLSPTLELDGQVAVATLMTAAMAAGEFDEALACAIELVATTGDVDRYGPRLFKLWGDQPADVLAELLCGVTGGAAPGLETSLSDFGPMGAAVAQGIGRRRRDSGAASVVRRGSAFGLK